MPAIDMSLYRTADVANSQNGWIDCKKLQLPLSKFLIVDHTKISSAPRGTLLYVIIVVQLLFLSKDYYAVPIVSAVRLSIATFTLNV